MKYDYKYFNNLYDENYKNTTWDGKSKLRKLRFEEIAKNIPAGKKVLDYGGGNGDLTKFIENEIDYHILDLSIEHKLDKFKRIELENDVYIKSEKETFDIVVLSEVLEHIPNAYETLREINRVLKNDGVLIISVPNAFSVTYILQSLIGANLDPSKEHLYLFDWSLLTNLLEAAGFKLISRSTFWFLQAKFYEHISFLEPLLSKIFRNNGTQLLCVYKKQN